MGLILTLEWGLSLALLWPYILGRARPALGSTAAFPSGCSLECVIRGANNRPGHSGHSMWPALN